MTLAAATLAATTARARAGAADPAQAGGTVTVRLGATPSDDMTPIVYGQKSGLFQRAGLDVQVTRMTSGAAIAAGVLAGTFDIGKSSLTTLFIAHEKGIPITLVAASTLYDAKAPYTAFVVAKDSPIQTGRDFNANVFVAVSAIGDLGCIALMAWVAQHGGDPAALKLVEAPFTAAAAAVQANRVAAAELTNPSLAAALEGGKLRVLPVFDVIGPTYLITAWFTTSDFSSRHPEVVRAFARAYGESTAYTNVHHAETAPLMAEFTGIALPTIERMVRSTCGTSLSVAQIQPVIDVSAKYGALKRAFAAQDMIDPNVK